MKGSATLSTTRGVIVVRDFLFAIVVVVVVAPLWVLPWRAAAALGRFYGRLAFVCWPLGRRAGMINLRRSYDPDMTRDEASRFIRRVFEHLAQGIAEGLQFTRRYKHGREGWDRCCVIEDPALEARILSGPRPRIFVTGHLGSWEIATLAAGIRVGSRGATVARRIDNPFLDALLRLVKLRDASQWIDKHGAVTEALTRLRRGDNVALLIDENAGARGVFVDFFGRPASTVKTAALLSLVTGAPIVVGAVVRRPDATLLYKLAAIEPSRESGPPAIRDLTQRITTQWEQWVRQYPDQWRWIHWRWKTRPDGTEEQYGRRELTACFSDGRPARRGPAENAPEPTRGDVLT